MRAFTSGLILVGMWAFGAGALFAQGEPAEDRPSLEGVRIGLTAGIGRPFLSADPDRIWDAVGGVGATPTLAVGVGYQRRRLGASVALDLASVRPDGRAGGAVSFVGALHWRQPATVGGIGRPILTVGYVRQVFGGVRFREGEFPLDTTDPPIRSSGPEAPDADVSTLADGARLGLALQRPLGDGEFTWRIGAAVDLLTFRQASVDGAAYDIRDPGWSVWPHLALGLEWWPF